MRSHPLGHHVEGSAAKAVEVLGEHPPGTVAAWIVHAPGQSPAWSHYLVSAVHLRDVDGAPAPVINVPGATHEVLVIALEGTPKASRPSTWKYLTPVNVVEQVELPSDDDATELVRLAVHAVCDGALPAEPALSGQVEPWRSTLIRTSAHMRGEPHAPCDTGEQPS